MFLASVVGRRCFPKLHKFPYSKFSLPGWFVPKIQSILGLHVVITPTVNTHSFCQNRASYRAARSYCHTLLLSQRILNNIQPLLTPRREPPPHSAVTKIWTSWRLFPNFPLLRKNRSAHHGHIMTSLRILYSESRFTTGTPLREFESYRSCVAEKGRNDVQKHYRVCLKRECACAVCS